MIDAPKPKGRRRHRPPDERLSAGELNGCLALARGHIAGIVAKHGERLASFDETKAVRLLAESLKSEHDRADESSRDIVARIESESDSLRVQDQLQRESQYASIVDRLFKIAIWHPRPGETEPPRPGAAFVQAVLEQTGRSWSDLRTDLAAKLRTHREWNAANTVRTVAPVWLKPPKSLGLQVCGVDLYPPPPKSAE